MMENLISEDVDSLKAACEPVQVEEIDNEQTDLDDYDTSSITKKMIDIKVFYFIQYYLRWYVK